ncbi:MAG: hypothetical protein ACI37Z_00960 [Candidatus Gastranaerophilaceae bacterium]
MNLSVKKFSKKSLSLLIALIMIISSVILSAPMTVQAAWGLSFKEGITVSGYPNNPAGMYYGGISSSEGNYTDYALYVIENVSGNQAVIASDGTFIVQKGSALTLRQNFGTWANNPNTSAGGTGVASNGLHWYFGNNTNYTIRLRSGTGKEYCKAYLDGGSAEQQTAVTGTLQNGTYTQNTFTAGTGNYGASNQAYVDYGFNKSDSTYFLNKVGTYTLNLFTPIALTYNNSVDGSGSYYNSKTSNKVNVKVQVVDGFTVTFKKSNGTVVETRKITVGNSIGAFPNNSPIEPNSASTIGDVHYTYSWPTTYNANSVITSDVTITEVETGAACSGGTATCQSQAVCSVCGVEYGALGKHSFEINDFDYDLVHVDADDDNNGYNYAACTFCGTESTSLPRSYDTTDWSAYNAELVVAQDEIANTAKYTAESLQSVSETVNEIINEVTPNDETKSQTYIDSKETALRTALNSLEIAKYSVTLRFKDENGVDVTNPEDSNSYKVFENIPYGDVTLAEVPTALEESGYSVYKWIRIDGNNDVLSGLNSNSLNVMVKKNMEYWVYLKKTAVDDSQASGKAVVTINNKSNKVYDIGYIDLNENTAVSVSSNNITIGGVTLTAPVYSFYNITGFNINGKIVTGTDTVSITKNTVIKPVYEPTLDAFIKRAENETFLINGKAEDLAVKWNQKVVLNTTDGTEVAWIAGIDRDGNGKIDSTEKNVVGYGSSYSFYANSNVTFYTESTAIDAPKTSIGLFSYNANENKVTLINNFYAPSGYTVKYAGVVLSTKTDNRDTLINQTNGRYQGGKSDFSGTDSNKNQLRISVSRTANTNFDMHALAYIIVEKPDGTEETIYADNVESIHYTATA